MSKTEIINEEPNFDEPAVQTKEDQFFGKQTEIDNKINNISNKSKKTLNDKDKIRLRIFKNLQNFFEVIN